MTSSRNSLSLRLSLRPRRGAGGFTLVEVMLALAILGLALVMLMRSAAGSLFATSQAQMLGIVTDLARGKMYDLEEMLLKNGFNSSDQTERGDFEEEGWASVEWEAKIEEVELPNLDTMKEVGQQASSDGGKGLADRTGAKPPPGAGSGSGSGSDAQSATGGFIEQFYGLISQLLKVGIRKITLVVKWKVVGRDRDLKVILYVTDASAMMKSVRELGIAGGEEEGSGSGSGTGSPPQPPGGFTRGEQK